MVTSSAWWHQGSTPRALALARGDEIDDRLDLRDRRVEPLGPWNVLAPFATRLQDVVHGLLGGADADTQPLNMSSGAGNINGDRPKTSAAKALNC